MTLLLLFAAAVIAIAAVFVASSKSDVHAVLAGDHPTDPSLAGQNTLVGLTDPAAETMAGGSVRRADRAWAMTTVNSLTDAEGMLDWAEVHGFAERELVVLGNSSFAVRWR